MDKNPKKLELKLKNIGYIKEANIDISGLTIIAGKNSMGKSTVGKALMAIIKARNIADNHLNRGEQQNIEYLREKHLNMMIELLFDSEISRKGKISFSVNGKEHYAVDIKSHKCEDFNADIKAAKEKEFLDCTFIQTPLIWDLAEFFETTLIMKENSSIYDNNFEIKYPYVLWDLFTKFRVKALDFEYREEPLHDIKKEIIKVIGGKFMKEEAKTYRFYSADGQDISLKNVAVGIKSFGIIQVLLDKNRFTPQGYFVFDEPENHLHPTWQLALAEILVILAKNGIRIMINTHSPYMLEALDKYSKKHNAYTKFYLADKGIVQQINGSNAGTLEEIFKKLNEPFKIFDEMENK